MEKIKLIENFAIDLDKLITEYLTHIEDKLQDRINPYVDIVVQRKYHIVRNNVAKDLLESMPYTKSVIDRVREVFEFEDVTYRVLHPCTSYRWHTDAGQECMHIPLITNEGSLFVYEDSVHRLNVGQLYFVNNGIFHTFVNSGDTHRVHLMFEHIDGVSSGVEK